MCVCTYVHTCVCMCVYVRAYVRVCMYVCVYVCYFLPGRTEIVEILLDAGMDPNCFDGTSGR